MTWIREEEAKFGYSILKSRAITWPVPRNKPNWFTKNEKINCCALVPVFDLWNHHPKVFQNRQLKIYFPILATPYKSYSIFVIITQLKFPKLLKLDC